MISRLGRHLNRWQQLNGGAVEAYETGHCDEGIEFTEEAHKVALAVFSETNANTLPSLNNPATVHSDQGRYGEAKPLHKLAWQQEKNVLCQIHPTTLLYQMNYAGLLVRMEKMPALVAQFQRMEPQRLAWVGAQLCSIRASGEQSRLLYNQSSEWPRKFYNG